METVRSTNLIKLCIEKLKKECKNYDFDLNNTFCDVSDIKIIMQNFTNNYPKSWEIFFNTLFDYRDKSEHIKRKTDNIFQIVFNIIHNSMQKTPMHISVAQSIHDTTRSKQLIQRFNRMGFGMSYDELEKMNYSLAERTLRLAENHRVPVPLHVKSDVTIQGAMDNFDHDENTDSGIGGSHDTVLVLFQNPRSKIAKIPLR